MLLCELEDTCFGEWSVCGVHVAIAAFCWLVGDFYIVGTLTFNYALAMTHSQRTAWVYVPLVYLCVHCVTWMLGFVGYYYRSCTLLTWYIYRCGLMVAWSAVFSIVCLSVRFEGAFMLIIIWMTALFAYTFGAMLTFRHTQFLQSIEVPSFGEMAGDLPDAGQTEVPI